MISLSNKEYVRQPIVAILGHVDVGKTTLLDKIRGTSVALREAGGITQHIGATFFPISTIETICSQLIKSFKVKIKIPGLLIIDTPGHEAFVNLRKRGGSIADIAILVVDLIKGFEAQTYECINILKDRKTPFFVAANKLDKCPYWVSKNTLSFTESFKSQSYQAQEILDRYIYKTTEEFFRLGFKADRFDRIKDFMRTVTIVPVSAKTGEGIAELLMVLVGLAQQYLMNRLMVTSGPAKGVVLEFRESPGLGATIDVIVYDGILKKGDIIVIGGLKNPIITKVRALFVPKPLDEMRDPEDKFRSINEVVAAAGVKIVAPNLDEALVGSPMYVARDEGEALKYAQIIKDEIISVKIERQINGIVLKTDALGSLEALIFYLSNKSIPIRIADVGDVNKRDIVEAFLVKQQDPHLGVILAFNVKVLPDAEDYAKSVGVPIFLDNVIYNLVEKYIKWYEESKQKALQIEYEELVKPGKIRIIPGYVFRRSDPAIVGVEVLSGLIKPGYKLIDKDGRNVGVILQIQDRGKPLSQASAGIQIAISIKGDIIIGRQVKEGDILYVDIPEEHVKILRNKFISYLDELSIKLIEELREIKRKSNPLWGL